MKHICVLNLHTHTQLYKQNEPTPMLVKNMNTATKKQPSTAVKNSFGGFAFKKRKTQNFTNTMNNNNNRRQTRQTTGMGGFVENPGMDHQYMYGNVHNNMGGMEYGINNNSMVMNNRHHQQQQLAQPVGNAGGIHQKLGNPERFHEALRNDVTEDERMSDLIAAITDAEINKARLNFGSSAEHVFLSDIIETVMKEFCVQVEEALVDDKIFFDEGPHQIKQKIEQKKDSLRKLREELYNESKRWDDMIESTSKSTQDEEAKALLQQELKRHDEVLKTTQHRGTLASSCLETHRALALQAEGAAAIVQGAEALCVRAENACEIFADALAKNDFKSLPNVDNPHGLLQSLIGAYKETKWEEGRGGEREKERLLNSIIIIIYTHLYYHISFTFIWWNTVCLFVLWVVCFPLLSSVIIFLFFHLAKKRSRSSKEYNNFRAWKPRREIKQHSRDDALVITNTTTFYTTDIFARELEKKERPILQK